MRRALDEGRSRLAASTGLAVRREAALLLGRVMGWSEAEVLARDDREIEAFELERFLEMIDRRAAGEPAAYLVGRREFYGRELRVDDRVLVPRPETEHLIEACLGLRLPPAPRILDVGTGSGCIAVTLALEIPGARVVATDRSAGALAVARVNALRFSAPVAPCAADLVAGLDLAVFDLVVSNPPYVPLGDAFRLPVDVREHEPAAALFGGERGSETTERLLAGLAPLRPGTPLVLEIGDGQAEAIGGLLRARGFEAIEVRPDYAGTPRVVIGKRAPWTASRS